MLSCVSRQKQQLPLIQQNYTVISGTHNHSGCQCEPCLISLQLIKEKMTKTVLHNNKHRMSISEVKTLMRTYLKKV
jgi:hypothetical protein